VTEVGACNFKIQKLPQKMAIIEDNANEDMKALKFCTDSILEEIDDTSESIKKAVNTIIGGTNHQNELDGIVEQRVTEFQKMKNKITRLKGSVHPRTLGFTQFTQYDPDDGIENSGKSRIPKFCYIQVIVFDLN